MRVLWRAHDGREFIIDTKKEGLKTNEDIMKHIAKLRKEHGYGLPTFMSVMGTNPVGKATAEDVSHVDVNDLDEEMRDKVKQAFKEYIVKPDPKKLN